MSALIESLISATADSNLSLKNQIHKQHLSLRKLEQQLKQRNQKLKQRNHPKANVPNVAEPLQLNIPPRKIVSIMLMRKILATAMLCP